MYFFKHELVEFEKKQYLTFLFTYFEQALKIQMMRWTKKILSMERKEKLSNFWLMVVVTYF